MVATTRYKLTNHLVTRLDVGEGSGQNSGITKSSGNGGSSGKIEKSSNRHIKEHKIIIINNIIIIGKYFKKLMNTFFIFILLSFHRI